MIIAVDNHNAEEYDTVHADIPGDVHNDTYDGTQGGDGDDDDKDDDDDDDDGDDDDDDDAGDDDDDDDDGYDYYVHS